MYCLRSGGWRSGSRCLQGGFFPRAGRGILAFRSIALSSTFISRGILPMCLLCIQTSPFHKDTSCVQLGPTLSVTNHMYSDTIFTYGGQGAPEPRGQLQDRGDQGLAGKRSYSNAHIGDDWVRDPIFYYRSWILGCVCVSLFLELIFFFSF